MLFLVKNIMFETAAVQENRGTQIIFPYFVFYHYRKILVTDY